MTSLMTLETAFQVKRTRDIPPQVVDKNYNDDYWWYLSSREFSHLVGAVAYAARVTGARSILDVGCGVGHLRRHFTGGEYIGLDFSEVAISIAREEHPDDHFFVGDIASTRITDSGTAIKIDCAVFSAVLEFLVKPEDWIPLIRAYLADYRLSSFVICDLQRVDFSSIDEAFPCVFEASLEATLTEATKKIPDVKRFRKVKAYKA